jgi:hypothetical protein
MIYTHEHRDVTDVTDVADADVVFVFCSSVPFQ